MASADAVGWWMSPAAAPWGLAERRQDRCGECVECPLDGCDLLGEAADLGECVVVGLDRSDARSLLAVRQSAVGVVDGCFEQFRRGTSCGVVVAGWAVAVGVLPEQSLGFFFDDGGYVTVMPYLVGNEGCDVSVFDFDFHDGTDEVAEVVVVNFEFDVGAGVDVHGCAPCWVRVTS